MAAQAQANRVGEQISFLQGMSSSDGSISMEEISSAQTLLSLRSELGVDIADYENNEAEYWRAAEIALNEYINSLHEGQQSLQLMQQRNRLPKSQTISPKKMRILGRK